ncbi:MAG: hypothetical protein WD055_05095 [Candidatus Dependentiae bacterium]
MKIGITFSLLVSLCSLNGMFVSPIKKALSCTISKSFGTKAFEINPGIVWLRSLNKALQMKESIRFVESHAALAYAFSREAGEFPDFNGCCEFVTEAYLSDLSKTDQAFVAGLAASIVEK